MPKVLLFTDKKSTPPLFKALSVEFEGRVAFGSIADTDKALVTQFGIEKFPSVVLITGTDASEFEKFKGMSSFTKLMRGVMKYAGLNEYLSALVPKKDGSKPKPAAKG